MTRPEMDPADYTKQLTVIVEKLWGNLDIKTNVKEMLQVISEFNRDIFDRPWLWAMPYTVELITEVADLRRTLIAQLNSRKSQLAPSFPAQTGASASASASAPAYAYASAPPPAHALTSAHASATAQLPAHDSAHASTSASAEVSPFWGTRLAYKAP